jgi:hypothetical protein
MSNNPTPVIIAAMFLLLLVLTMIDIARQYDNTPQDMSGTDTDGVVIDNSDYICCEFGIIANGCEKCTDDGLLDCGDTISISPSARCVGAESQRVDDE